MTRNDLPGPLIPAFVNLQAYDWFRLYHKRLRRSSWWIRASDKAKAVSIELWCAAYEEVPAGSLPDDDLALALAAGFGSRNVADWQAVKDEIMSAWTLCSDGRWYHPTLSEIALEAWDHREAQRKIQREKKARQRGKSGDVSRDKPGTLWEDEGTFDDDPGDNANVPGGQPDSLPGKTAHTRQDKTRQKNSSPDGERTPHEDDEAIGPAPKVKKASEAPGDDEVKVGKTGKRATRLSGEWKPSERNVDDAIKIGLDPTQIVWVADKFRNYWSAKPGKNGTSLNWDANWRMWCQNEIERGSGPNVRRGAASPNGRRSERDDRIGEMLEGAREALDRRR